MSVRHAMLGLLSHGPQHGYLLRAAFEALVGGEANWDVKPAQVYTTLTRLEVHGLIRQESVAREGGPEKRVYAITPEGRKRLASWFASGVGLSRPGDEFFVKLMLSVNDGGAGPSRVIRAQRSALFKELHDLTARRSKADPRTELSTIFLLDRAVMHVEADLRWLDMIEARLDELGRQQVAQPRPRPRGRPRKSP